MLMVRNRLFLTFLLPLILVCCDSDTSQRNPFLQEVGFRFEINLNLPLYSPLTTTGNAVYIGNTGVGIRGVFVMNTGFDLFRAFEATCPNHAPNACSTMVLDGQVARCGCEDFEYSLFTGQQLNRPNDGSRYFDMLEYRASQSGSSLFITN
jgi:nitrite reductase/ring-hydroxylating ferredoxin subunit